MGFILKINEECLSAQRQNISFDYATKCGEQALIDTTPFKSHLLRVVFVFRANKKTADSRIRNLLLQF